MKVLYPFFGDSVGGAIHSLLALLESMKTEGYSSEAVFVLHRPNDQFKQLLLANGYKYILCPIPKKSWPVYEFFYSLIKIIKFIKINRANLIHGNDIRVNLRWSIAAFLLQVPYVWHQRSMVGGSKYWPLLNFGKKKFIAVSKMIQESFPLSFQDKVMVCTDPVVIQNLKSYQNTIKYSVEDKLTHLGYFGRLVPQKNLPYLLEVIKKLKTHIKLQVHIWGNGDPGYVQKLKEIVQTENLDKEVIFGGYCDEVYTEMAKMDLILTMAINDGWGRTIVESQLLEIKVVASDSGGHKGLITNEFEGRLVPLNNANEATQVILKYLSQDFPTPKVESSNKLSATTVWKTYQKLISAI